MKSDTRPQIHRGSSVGRPALFCLNVVKVPLSSLTVIFSWNKWLKYYLNYVFTDYKLEYNKDVG